MRFVADEMVGKLARWMRFMGLDVEYRRPFPDSDLIESARSEKRVILTRDRRIIEKLARNRASHPDYKTGDTVGEKSPQEGAPVQPIEVWAIEEDLPFDQLVTIVKRLGVDPFERAFTRCAVCNRELIARTREEVTGKAPPFVYANVREYRECLSCGKIYWAGSHRARIERILGEVREKALGLSPDYSQAFKG